MSSNDGNSCLMISRLHDPIRRSSKIKSYDDMGKVEKLRDTTASNTLAYENQETTIQLTDQLVTHPFFEVLPEGT